MAGRGPGSRRCAGRRRSPDRTGRRRATERAVHARSAPRRRGQPRWDCRPGPASGQGTAGVPAGDNRPRAVGYPLAMASDSPPPLTVGPLTAAPGTRVTGLVAVELGAATVELPVVLINGARPGPRVAATAGIH